LPRRCGPATKRAPEALTFLADDPQRLDRDGDLFAAVLELEQVSPL
jgi:hypothetical protein